MPWLEIVITCIALGAMAVGVRRLRGPGGGYWVWAWTALIVTAGLILLSPDRPALRTLAHAAAPLFPLLLLVGAIHFAGRRPSPWLALLGIALIGLRSLAAENPDLRFMTLLAGVSDPILVGLAAWIVHRAVPAGASIAQRWLAPGLAVIAAMELVGNLRGPSYEIPWALWVAVAIPNMCLQAYVVLEKAWSTSRSAQQALHTSEASLRDAQRIAQVGSYEWLPDTDESIWSEENYRIFGWDPQGGASNERFLRAVHPDDRPALVTAVAESLNGGGPVDLEFRILRPGGEERIIHGRGETTFDAAGRPVRHQGTTHDITERQRTRDALQASEERMRAILNALEMDKVVVIDRQGMVRAILGNAGESSRYGIGASEVPGRHIRDFLPGSDGQAVVAEVERAFASGEPREVEASVLFPNGRFHFEVSLRPRLERSSRVESVLAVVRDVTARRRSEIAARESEERLRAILSSLHRVRVVVLDRDGRVLSIYGGHPDDLHPEVDRNTAAAAVLEGLMEPEQLLGGRRLVREVFDTGRTHDLRQVIEMPDGQHVFDVILSPLRDGTDEIHSVLAVARDVTRQVRDAEQNSRMEAQLQQAQKLESLGVLAGGIAHDFNNLLVGILSNAETALVRADADAPLQRPLEDILHASERAADLTQQLLAYAGKAKFSAHTLNLAWLVDEMTPLLRPVVAGGAHIEIVRDAEDAWIHADGTQVRQLIMNLITNSSEALGHSGGRIRVRTDARRVDRAYLEGCYLSDEVSEGRFAVLEVSDDGEGMSPETRERIFDPFFTTKFQGRGLGLASAIGIVRSHGGTIRVESATGRGTTFTVLLPCSEPGVLPGEATQPVPELGGGSVLVVDDEALVRSAARRMLEFQGFQVIEAESGAEAIALVRAGSVEIDVLLVDVTMPGLNGEQTLDGVRQILPDLPVVFMSGHSVEEVTERVAERSNASHLHKPFRLSDLGKAVRAALDPEGGAPS